MSRKTLRKTQKVFFKLNLILAIVSWLGIFVIIFLIHPAIWQSLYYFPFFLILFIAIASTLQTIFKKLAISLTIPLGIIAILGLRLFGIRDWLNPILIAGLVATLIYFFTSTNANGILRKKANLKDKSTNLNNQSYASFQKENQPKPAAGNK